MSVSINFLNFGGRNPGNFADPLDNSVGANVGPLNNPSVNNFNWVYTVLGLDTPIANPPQIGSTYSFGQALSGGGGTGMTSNLLQFGANPPYYITNGIIPIRLLPGLGSLNSPFYASKQKFIQFTFNAIGVNNAGGVGLINFEDKTGVGAIGNSNINHDCYMLRCDGNLIRYNSGAANSVLQGAIAFTQGDVWRMSMDATNAAQTIVTLTKNGTQFTQITDNNAGRLTGPAVPVIAMIASSVATWQFEIKLFSCGIGL